MKDMEQVRIVKDENNYVKLSGRINADNAEAAEAELFRIKEENPGEPMVLDFEKLKYISSSGLRVLLKIGKTMEDKLKIINTPPMIYEIFEDTGLANLFDISKPMKNYSLDGLDLIGRGTNGEVYRLDRERIIKVFQKSVPL
jgi:anti-anti-sigma factor